MLQSPTMEMHRLHLLCLCELGENGIGLQRRKSMNCDTHHELLKLIVDMANQDWTDDAGHIQRTLPSSGTIPSSRWKKSCSTAA